MTRNQPTVTDLYMDTIDVLAGAGFLPADDTDDELTAIERATVTYFIRKGFDAYRSNAEGLTFVRYGEDGIDLLSTTPNGVTTCDARFHFNQQGVRWLAGAVAS